MKKSFPVIFSLLLVSVFGIRAGFAEDGASSVDMPAGESAAATQDSGNAQTDAAADAADHANGEAAAIRALTKQASTLDRIDIEV